MKRNGKDIYTKIYTKLMSMKKDIPYILFFILLLVLFLSYTLLTGLFLGDFIIKKTIIQDRPIFGITAIATYFLISIGIIIALPKIAHKYLTKYLPKTFQKPATAMYYVLFAIFLGGIIIILGTVMIGNIYKSPFPIELQSLDKSEIIVNLKCTSA